MVRLPGILVLPVMFQSFIISLVLVCSVGCSNPGRTAFAASAGDSSADVAAEINSQIATLPDSGGIIDLRSLTGQHQFLSTVVLSKPVTLLLGAAQFTCNIAGPGPCIRILKPSHIGMMRGSLPSAQAGAVPMAGTMIQAGSGFTGFLISVEGTQNWNTAYGTMIEGGLLDGNKQAAGGIHIQNQFGVQVRDLNIVRPDIGIQLENTDQLWTEGSWLNNVSIFDPRTAGIDMRSTGTGTTSVANAMWERIYINLYTSGSLGLRSDGVLFSSSEVNLLKIWMSSGNDGLNCSSATPVTLTGLQVSGNMIGTTFYNMDVEALSCPGATLSAVKVDPSVIQPSFVNLMVQGLPLPSVQWGRSYQNGQQGVMVYNSSLEPNVP